QVLQHRGQHAALLARGVQRRAIGQRASLSRDVWSAEVAVMNRTSIIVLCLFAAPARAHVGAKVSLAQFDSPAPLVSATDGGLGPNAIAVADASFVVSWYDGDMDPTGHYFFYYLDHSPPTGLSTDDVKNQATPIADV